MQACVADKCGAACNPPEDWSCLGSVQWPAPAQALLQSPTGLDLTVAIRDAFTTPVQQAFDVIACSDSDCSTPLGSGQGTGGWAKVAGIEPVLKARKCTFFDYLRASFGTPDAGSPSAADAGLSSYPDALLYFFPPVRESPHFALRDVVNRAFADENASAVGMKLDWSANKGGIVWTGTSCGGARGSGMVVSIDTGDRAFYTRGTMRQLDPDAVVTGPVGIGAFLNVEPGSRTLTATVTVNGVTETVGKYTVLVAPGSVTYLTMTPAPASTPTCP
jgi:hypothetical protein